MAKPMSALHAGLPREGRTPKKGESVERSVHAVDMRTVAEGGTAGELSLCGVHIVEALGVGWAELSSEADRCSRCERKVSKWYA